MSNDRRVLGLKKTPAQKATERHEDALMQKVVAEEGFEDVKQEPKPLTFKEEPYAGESPPPANEAIVLDESLPYATVRGVPGVEYVQGKDYYDRSKRMVREAPTPAWYFAEAPSKKKSLMEEADAARGELKRKGLWHNVPGHDAPRKNILADIEKENARAAAAEANAA